MSRRCRADVAQMSRDVAQMSRDVAKMSRRCHKMSQDVARCHTASPHQASQAHRKVRQTLRGSAHSMRIPCELARTQMRICANLCGCLCFRLRRITLTWCRCGNANDVRRSHQCDAACDSAPRPAYRCCPALSLQVCIISLRVCVAAGWRHQCPAAVGRLVVRLRSFRTLLM